VVHPKQKAGAIHLPDSELAKHTESGMKTVDKLLLLPEEVDAIQSLLRDITSKYKSAEDDEFLSEACLYAHELPRRIRKAVNSFKTTEPRSSVFLISGYPVVDSNIGRTPEHWKRKAEASPAMDVEALLILLGALLGEALGWATQQGGSIIHDILPIKECENEQLGTGSLQTLWWHNEDAFHNYRADYVGMACLRNPDNVATTIASIDDVRISQADIELLFEPHFTIRPDNSHQEKNTPDISDLSADPTDPLRRSYKRIAEMNGKPAKVSILYGHPQSPYIRIDPYFMDPLDEGNPARQALERLIEEININLSDVAMQPGEFLFIDNCKAVHGRKPFKARYDGADRWLKRINVARDLRKSRSARANCNSRIIW
jgi:Fe(II)/alpha-ketoglutarate-dependent arginine beta-hydroxylase